MIYHRGRVGLPAVAPRNGVPRPLVPFGEGVPGEIWSVIVKPTVCQPISGIRGNELERTIFGAQLLVSYPHIWN